MGLGLGIVKKISDDLAGDIHLKIPKSGRKPPCVCLGRPVRLKLQYGEIAWLNECEGIERIQDI